MPLIQSYPLLSAEDYLESEKSREVRHEFCDGIVVAMAGASRAHNLIAGYLQAQLHNRLAGSDCRVYMSDMKLRVQSQTSDRFFYPDLMVSCDPNPPSDYYEDKPVLLIEVLSDSTEVRDRLEKHAIYQRIPSLREYLLVAQDRPEVTKYSFNQGYQTVCQYGEVDHVPLASVDFTFLVSDLYLGLI